MSDTTAPSVCERHFTFCLSGLDVELDVATEWNVIRFEVTEAVSQTYHCEVTVCCPHTGNIPSDLMQCPAQLCIEHVSHRRFIHGMVSAIALEDVTPKHKVFRFTLSPRLYFLGLRSGLRIFQHLTIPEIVTQVLTDAGFKGDDFRLELTEHYPKQDYCTQYHETDLEFLQRIIIEAGLSYWTEHQADHHRLIITDNIDMLPDISGNTELPWIARSGANPDQDSIFSFTPIKSIATSGIRSRAFNFKKPTQNLEIKFGESLTEHYTYPGDYTDTATGQRQAKLTLAQINQYRMAARGLSSCHRLAAGHRFTLYSYPQQNWNQAYILTRVTLRGEQPQALGSETNDQKHHFNVAFDVAPASQPLVPPRIYRRPNIAGVQSAVVTGPNQQELYCDKYGRIKVQFHWDRSRTNNEHSSCWIRVSQAWAGNQWGSLALPRVGQEVLVAFLHGDPNQPIVVGSLYNGTNTCPDPLPQNQNRTSFRSNSTPGSGGQNEFSFDDTKDQESIYIHGQKDLDIYVNNDWKQTIKGDCHSIVKSQDYLKVGNDWQRSIQGNLTECVEGSLSSTVGGNWTQWVNEKFITTVAGALHASASGNIVLDAGSHLTLRGGGGSVVLDASGVAIQGLQVRINSGGAAASTLPASCQPPKIPRSVAPGAGGLPLQAITQLLNNQQAQIVHDQRQAQKQKRLMQQTELTQDQQAQQIANIENVTIASEPSWITIELHDDLGEPLKQTAYRIVDSNGQEFFGVTNEQGQATLAGIPQGHCSVSFPQSESWKQS